MIGTGDLLAYAARRALWAARWFAREFLWIAEGLSPAGLLTSLARLVGLAIGVSVAHLSLSGSLVAGWPQAIAPGVVSILVAILMGNVEQKLRRFGSFSSNS